MDGIEREAAVETNRREYADAYGRMRWIGPEEAARTEEERRRLLDALGEKVSWCFGSTKADCRGLSPGCRLCGEGSWSCLFVNGVCNARCFSCPTEQREVGEPVTNTLTFHRPELYAAYLRRFGLRGASMSGGEPLLTADRTFRFLQASRAALGAAGYLWLYTNGILLTREVVELLAEAGLDEIRFDLAAVDYDPAPVRLATGRIGAVTVEVPAIPEDEARLTALLPALVEAGVRRLNLHELRCTPHNLPGLARRGYTFRHGPRVTVVGSELAALRVLLSVADRGLGLAVNYCSSIYKARHQGRAARARAAEAARDAHESVSGAGYLRVLEARGSSEQLRALDSSLRAAGAEQGLWRLDGPAGRLEFHPSLWPRVGGAPSVWARYHLATLRDGVSYQAAFREIELEAERSIVVERTPASEPIRLDSASAFAPASGPAAEGVPGITDPSAAPWERLPEGLLPYF